MVLIVTSLLVWAFLTAGLSAGFAWRWYRRRNAEDARQFAKAYAALTATSVLVLLAYGTGSPVLVALILAALIATASGLVHGIALRARQGRPSKRLPVETLFTGSVIGVTLATLAFIGLNADGLAACLDIVLIATFVTCAILEWRGPHEPDRIAAGLCALAAIAFSLRIGAFAAGISQGRYVRGAPALEHANLSFLIGVTVLLVVGAALTFAIRQDDAAWARVQALYDPATSLLKRPPFFIMAQSKINAAYDLPHVIALIDIDHLGDINAKHGEARGNAILARLGRMMWEGLPRHALAGRFGDDEIVLFFPNATLETVEPVLNALRTRIEAEPWPHDGPVTVSMGQAAFVKGERVDDALVLADAGVQHVKMNGRDAVRTVRPGDFDDPMALSASGGRSVRRIDRSKQKKKKTSGRKIAA